MDHFHRLRPSGALTSVHTMKYTDCQLREATVRMTSLHLELRLIQSRIDPAPSDQRLMRPIFHHTPMLEDNGAIHTMNRRETMGDDNRRPPSCQLVQSFSYFDLGFRVNVRCRLVEHHDRGIFQQHARDRHPLTLTDGQLDSPLTDPCIVSFGKRRNELGRPLPRLRHQPGWRKDSRTRYSLAPCR
jgi:hypothetical protein